MREGLCFCSVLVLSVWAAPAEVQTQTFPVTVSNAVSGKLETVPVTFRFGATNGLVERFDGARFVPVPVKAYDFSQRDNYMRRQRADVPEWALCSRLEKLILPAQSFESMPLSNAAERVAQAIRRQDQDAPFQMRVAVWLPSAGFRLPAFSVSETNALGVLRVLAEIASEAAKQASGRAGASLPITFGFRGADTVILRHDDDGAITRGYPVPRRFWEWFLNEDEFLAYVQKRLQTGDWVSVRFLSFYGKIRVNCFSSKVMAKFESEAFEPLLAGLLRPLQWRPAACKSGDVSSLYFRGSNKGDCCGLWHYQAMLAEDGAFLDTLASCPVLNGMADDVVVGPKTLQANQADGQMQNAADVFLLFDNDGWVARVAGESVIPVECEVAPTPLLPKDAPRACDTLRERLNGVILPEFAMWGGHITNGLAQIQAALQASGTPTNDVRIEIDMARIADHAKDQPLQPENSDPFSMACTSVPDLHAITNVSSFATKNISAGDALNLLANITRLEILFDGKRQVGLIDYITCTQKMARVRVYELPALLCRHVRDSAGWVSIVQSNLPTFCSVESFSPATGKLSVRSVEGRFDGVNAALEEVYEQFPGRFTLENKEVGGRVELLLTDTYRDIVRRYRSGVGKDGKRWERFEVVR